MPKPVDVRKKWPIVAVGKTDKKALWEEAMQQGFVNSVSNKDEHEPRNTRSGST